jgi:uncharacterized membrane protein YhaH (DUF805 family)
MEWMLMPYRRYADFSGRSRRKEYWMFTLFLVIVYAVLATLLFAGGFSLDPTSGEPSLGALGWLAGGLFALFALGSLVPTLAVIVRRLHDQDKSGWFILLQFIPYVGGIIIFVFMCLDGTRGENRFGPDPKGVQNLGEVFS